MDNEKKEFEHDEIPITDVNRQTDGKEEEQNADTAVGENGEKTDHNENVSTSSKILAELVSWAKLIVAALILATLLNKFVVFNFCVPTESMENTIMVDNRIMSLRCAYLFSDPKRGDIIVFPFPDNPEETFIKRIIGLPGENVEGKDGIVYINGEPLEEDYVTSELDADFGPYEVPENSYFVLGDNRDVSLDARYWDNKFVKREDIISKAIFRFYPGFEVLK